MFGTHLDLAYATAFFVLIHFLVSGSPLRGVFVGIVGEAAFRGLFALFSLAGLVWMAAAYRVAPYDPVWSAGWFTHVPHAVMPFALIALVAARTTPSPTGIGGEKRLAEPPRGIARITRHPMMWAVALWAAAHLVARGDVAALIFFGGLLVLSLFGPLQIDAKRRHADRDTWRDYAAVTSYLPFGAVIARRTRLSWSEIGWRPVALGLAIYAALLLAHRLLFGTGPGFGW